MLDKFHISTAKSFKSRISNLRSSELATELGQTFKEKYPILLDGALIKHSQKSQINKLFRNFFKNTQFGSFLSQEDLRLNLTKSSSFFPNSFPDSSHSAASMVPVSPKSMFIWWDVKLLSLSHDIMQDTLRDYQEVLRFYDITDLDPESKRWHHSFDIEVDFSFNKKTIDFWSDDKTYRVDVGLKFLDGRFLVLAKTNAIRLPRGSVGDSGSFFVDIECNRSPSPRKSLEFNNSPEDFLWFNSTVDSPSRDYQAEMLVRSIYQSFKAEGPRVIRNATKPHKLCSEQLTAEYSSRQIFAKGYQSRSFSFNTDFLLAKISPSFDSIINTEVNYPVQFYKSPLSLFSKYHLSVTNFTYFFRLLSFSSCQIKLPCQLQSYSLRSFSKNPLPSVYLSSRSSKIQEILGLRSNSTFRPLLNNSFSEDPFTIRISGKARPGSKLFISGHSVTADKHGNFQVDHLLSMELINNIKNIILHKELAIIK